VGHGETEQDRDKRLEVPITAEMTVHRLTHVLGMMTKTKTDIETETETETESAIDIGNLIEIETLSEIVPLLIATTASVTTDRVLDIAMTEAGHHHQLHQTATMTVTITASETLTVVMSRPP
jgi:hypothetical protein